MDQTAISSVTAAARECNDPNNNPQEYIRSLLILAFEALGYDSENLSFREGVERALEIQLNAPENSLIVIDLNSIMTIPMLSESLKTARIAIATQTIGTNFSPEDYQDLDALLKAGLSGVTQCYTGLVSSPQEVEAVSGTSKVLQLRRIHGGSPVSPQFDRMLEEDTIWAALPSISGSAKGLVIWDGANVNELGYIGDALMPYERSLPTFDRLSAVLELHEEIGAWLFDWNPQKSETTSMIDCTSLDPLKLASCNSQKDLQDAEQTVEVTNNEVALNRNYCPAYYLSGDYLHAEDVPLRELAGKIQRGTTLSGKDLDVIGSIYKRDRAEGESTSRIARIASLGGPTPFSLKRGSFIIRRDDFWYIDNACIQPDGTVIPKVIAEIPAGQKRYTLYPEDGMCILIPRNGKAIVPFIAKAPTLVSNNLFLVRLKPGEERSEYISCLLRSSLIKSQVATAPKPLSKEDVGNLVLPILSKENQSAIVDRDTSIRHKIIDLQNEIALLEMLDPFDPLEANGLENTRKEKLRILKGGTDGE